MTFRDILKQVKEEKPIKELTPDTKLPYVFDMLWDVKTYRQLVENGLLKNKEAIRHLREAGFRVDE